jgi:hypothetical protein
MSWFPGNGTVFHDMNDQETEAPDEVLMMLRATPKRIAAAATGLEPDQLRATPAGGGWSANEVLAHLRSCADVWGTAIAKILAEDKPTIRAISPRSWIRKTNYVELEFWPSLRAFTGQRQELLVTLEALAPEDWRRIAIVTGAGKVLERTVTSYAQWLVHHERPHIKQIKAVADSMRRS